MLNIQNVFDYNENASYVKDLSIIWWNLLILL